MAPGEWGSTRNDTTWTSNDTSWTSWTNTSYTDCNHAHYEQYTEKYKAKILEFIRKQSILDMKANWNEFKKEFKPVPKIRLAVQLRGVCFNGRGWA